MSLDFTAHTVYGIRIDRKALRTNVTTLGCAHPHSSKFCPTCGAARQLVKEVDIPGWDGDTFMGLYVIRPGYNGNDVIIGINLCCASQEAPAAANPKVPAQDTLHAAHDKLQCKLKDTPFGHHEPLLWTILCAG